MAGGSRSTDPIAAGQRRVGAPGGRPAPEQRPRHRRDPLLDPDAPGWVHGVSIALCVLLVLAALIALAFQRPGAISLREREFGSASARGEREPRVAGLPALPRTPTVESLVPTSASAAALAAVQDQTLAGGLVRERDVIAAGAKPACFGLEPEGEICLGPSARMRIGALGQGVELLGGRAVVSVERLGVGASLAVALGALGVEARDAVFGVELDADTAAVRVLRGAALVSYGERADTLISAHSALFRGSARGLEIVPQPADEARRDWELLAARSARN